MSYNDIYHVWHFPNEICEMLRKHLDFIWKGFTHTMAESHTFITAMNFPFFSSFFSTYSFPLYFTLGFSSSCLSIILQPSSYLSVLCLCRNNRKITERSKTTFNTWFLYSSYSENPQLSPIFNTFAPKLFVKLEPKKCYLCSKLYPTRKLAYK